MIPLKRKRATLEMGQDAFLDIVANLVGVLIILVVVLGTQSQKAIREIHDEQAEEERASPEQLSVLSEQAVRAAAAQADSDRLERTVRQFDAEIAVKNQQRAMLLDLLAEAQLAWESSKRELSSESTEIAAQLSELARLESQLAELEGERERLESEPAAVIAVEHLPTPMAKTVFGDEIHFRLKDNRVSVVPIEKLIDEIRRDFGRTSRREGRSDSAVGPVRGYVARYEMNTSQERVTRGDRTGMAMRVELTEMSVEPLTEPFGQTIDAVIRGSSELDVELAGRDPAKTTITVWVYPDSFAAFRQLKEHLYRKGFATAARPLPMDRLISGGPQGSRSSAQ